MSNFTTELESVNTMLSAVGSSPVSDLTGGAEVSIAKNILTETRREVCSKGWAFNYETKVTLTPTTENVITLTENVLRVDATEGYNTDLDLVQRGTKLYDRKNHTYTITDTVTADVIYNLDWSELPEVARRYIMIRAARVFADRVVGYSNQHAFTMTDETQALADLKALEAETADHNMLTGHWHVARVVNRRSVVDNISY
ncbi:MAG: putative tail tubular protein [Prokaryotic dsDNA virus sp.]|nr:MAG: putative tail tubular protein [Prokaryotic dsDNA virus sp.]